MSRVTIISHIGNEEHANLANARMTKYLEDMKKIIHFSQSKIGLPLQLSVLWKSFNGITYKK